MEPDPELLQIFREETGERLDAMVDRLLAAEAGGAGSEDIDALFRDTHSIKGNAGMLGFHEAGEIAAAMEDILARAREAGTLAPELAPALLQATDAIRGELAGEQGAGAKAIAELRDASEASASGETATEPAAPEHPAPEQPAATGSAPAPVPAPASSPAPPAPPATTIRVDTGKVDRLLDVVGETVLHRRRLDHLIGNALPAGEERLGEELGQGDLLLDDLQESVIQMRTLPLSTIVGRYPRAVRDIAAAEGREVRLEMSGTETQLDRVILDGLSETIVHLLRNAVSHGIEPPGDREAAGKDREGRVELRAEPRGGLVAITVADDGRGVSPELFERARERGSLAEVLAEAGFSTAAEVSELSGRGVGLDAVKRHAESLGGSLEATSEPGAGTVFTLLVPLTLALLRLLLVERGGHSFGLPLASVLEAVTVDREVSLSGRTSLELRGTTIPLSDLADAIGATAGELEPGAPAVVVTSSGRRAALRCDRMLGEREAVVKSLGHLLEGVPGYLGAVVLAEGPIALILDPGFLVRGEDRRRTATAPSAAVAAEPSAAPRVLVVDDQFTVRELQRSILEAGDYEVITAPGGQEALAALAHEGPVDLVVTDIAMPGMDGLELLAAIRADQATTSLPVVVVTSKASEEDRRRGAEAGADAYIVKSEFDQQTLLETVARLVGLR